MKPDCNVNVKEIGNIVNEMMADKNKTGRAVFEVMTNEQGAIQEEKSLDAVVELMTAALKIINKAAKVSPDRDTAMRVEEAGESVYNVIANIEAQWDEAEEDEEY
jgi:hypothetical protein